MSYSKYLGQCPEHSRYLVSLQLLCLSFQLKTFRSLEQEMSTVKVGLDLGPSLRSPAQIGVRALTWSRTAETPLGLRPFAPSPASPRPISHSTSIPKDNIGCVIYLLGDLRHVTFFSEIPMVCLPQGGVMQGKRPLNYLYCPSEPVSTSVK